MEPIRDFQIQALSIQGLKCQAKRQAYALGQYTDISGENGRGKSAIADALAYIFYGTVGV